MYTLGLGSGFRTFEHLSTQPNPVLLAKYLLCSGLLEISSLLSFNFYTLFLVNLFLLTSSKLLYPTCRWPEPQILFPIKVFSSIGICHNSCWIRILLFNLPLYFCSLKPCPQQPPSVSLISTYLSHTSSSSALALSFLLSKLFLYCLKNNFHFLSSLSAWTLVIPSSFHVWCQRLHSSLQHC